MPTQILVPGVTPTYKNTPRADVTPFYDAAAWVTAGLSLWARADSTDPAPSGAEFDILDRRPSSTRKQRQPTGQTDVTVAQGLGYLGNRKTVLMVNADQWLDSDVAVLPSTGEFAMYIALHPHSALGDLLGQPGVTNGLRTQIVNGAIRFAINSGTTTLVADTGLGSGLKDRDMILGFMRRADGHLVTRYRLDGQTTWTEVVSAGVIGNGINTSLRLGRQNTDSGSSYRLQARVGEVLVHSGALSTDQRAEYENYLGGYYALN